jgi:hypothetical protein
VRPVEVRPDEVRLPEVRTAGLPEEFRPAGRLPTAGRPLIHGSKGIPWIPILHLLATFVANLFRSRRHHVE